jgi:hypothetical protein
LPQSAGAGTFSLPHPRIDFTVIVSVPAPVEYLVVILIANSTCELPARTIDRVTNAVLQLAVNNKVARERKRF